MAVTRDDCQCGTEFAKVSYKELDIVVDVIYPEASIEPDLNNVVMRAQAAKAVVERADDLVVNKPITATHNTHMRIKVDAVAAHFSLAVKDDVVVHGRVNWLVVISEENIPEI